MKTFVHSTDNAVTPQNETLHRTTTDYLRHLAAAGRAAATLDSYRHSLALLEGCPGTGLAIEDLSAGTLDQALLFVSADGERKAQATLNRHRSAWRSFSRWAFETGRIAVNPAVLLRLAPPDSTPTAAFSLAETVHLLSEIRKSGHALRLRDETLFSVYALTGVRRAEALSLKIGDYDAGAGILRVRDSKNGRVRKMPVTGQLGALLDRFRAGIGAACTVQHRLFAGQNACSGLTVRQVQARFAYWRSVTGLRRELTIHSFRAGFATVLYSGTGDVALVARALGHCDLRPTLRYIDPAAGNIERAIRENFDISAYPHRHGGQRVAGFEMTAEIRALTRVKFVRLTLPIYTGIRLDDKELPR